MSSSHTQADTQQVQRVLTRDDVLTYAQLTDDFNPIHVDEAFAAESPFGQTIVHGTLTLTLVWELLALLDGPDAINGISVDVRFTAPVVVGSTVTAVLQESGDDHVRRVVVRGSDGAVALTAEVRRS